MQAGNRYHHIYAASLLVQMLDPTSGIQAIRLEGVGAESDEDDVVDVAVERRDGSQLVQVKWARRAGRRTLTPGDFWAIIAGLLKTGKRLRAGLDGVEVRVHTNRSPSRTLQSQIDLLDELATLPDDELIARVSEARASSSTAERTLFESLREVAGSEEVQIQISVIRCVKADCGLGSAALDQQKSLLDERLKAQSLPSDRCAPIVIDKVAEYCAEHPGKAITGKDISQWLGVSSSRLSHDVPLPEEYIPFPGFADLMNPLVEKLGPSGGLVVLTGPPGCGKTIQLAMWARAKGYPFYACRLGDRDDDIRERAAQHQFVFDLQQEIQDRYPGRIAVQAGRGTRGGASSEAELRQSLSRMLEALGGGSGESEPAVLVIDGVDDISRSGATDSLLDLLQRPPSQVVLIVSAQGHQFLPPWMRRRTQGAIDHQDMPPFPDEEAATLVSQLLGLDDDEGSKQRRSSGNVVESVVSHAKGNLLVLRAICEQLRNVDASKRSDLLKSLGEAPFEDVTDYYSRLLVQPSAGALAWLRPLALVRDSLSVRQLEAASGSDANVLIAAQGEIDFLLLRLRENRFRLFHPSLRQFVKETFFEDEISTLHSRLADIAEEATLDDPLAGELPFHLAAAGRHQDVIDRLNHSFFDAQFEELTSPSLIRDQLRILTEAAAQSGDLRSAFRAHLLDQKAAQRMNEFIPRAHSISEETDDAFLILIRVLLSRGSTSRAIELLREIPEPASKLRTALMLAVEAFESGRLEDGDALYEIARRTVLFYAPPQDLRTASHRVACRVWKGDPLTEIITDTISVQWVHANDNFEDREPLSEAEQVSARCDTLRAAARAAARANRAGELREIIEGVAGPYRLAVATALCEISSVADQTDIDRVVHLAGQGHLWSEGAKRIAANLILDHTGDVAAATDAADLATPLPAAPLAIQPRLGIDDLSAQDWLELFKLRAKAGCEMRVQLEESARARDDRIVAARMYYRSALALVAAEIAVSTRSHQAAGLIRIAWDQWTQQKPYNLGWSETWEARAAIRELTPRLLCLAFELDRALGEEIGDALWHLDSKAIGILDNHSKLDVLVSLAALPAARPWVERRLREVESAIRTNERETAARVPLLFATADVARRLGLIDDARGLISEAVRATKGLPGTDEELRYYAALETLDCLSKRGADTVSDLRRLGRLMQASRGVTASTYAGDWLSLIKSLGQADLPSAFDLVIELSRNAEDDGLPYTRTMIRHLARSIPSLSAAEFVALLWIAGAEDEGEAGTVAHLVRSRVSENPGSLSPNQLIDWATGALIRDIPSPEVPRVMLAIESGGDSGSASAPEEPNGLLDVIGDAEIITGAESGEPAQISRALAMIRHRVDDAGDSASSLPHEVASFLDRIAPHIQGTDELGEAKTLHDQIRSYSFASKIDVLMATRQATVNSAQSRDRLLEILDDVSWDGGGLVAEALHGLARIDPTLARREMVRRIAVGKRVYDPYHMARELSRISSDIVAESDLVALFEALCEDIEDSLDITPSEESIRPALEESHAPEHSTVADFVRDLLDNREESVRRRAREAVGILARDDTLATANALARWTDLGSYPPHELMTAIEVRLAALWVIAEIDASAVVHIAPMLHTMFVKGRQFSGHFLIREYARRICHKALTRDADCLPSESVAVIQQSPVPMKLHQYPDEFNAGRSWGLLVDGSMEWDISALAKLFRVNARHTERIVEWIADRMHDRSEADRALDAMLINRRYRQRSQVLTTSHEEVLQHSYRLLQARWFESRAADQRVWLKEGRWDLERRRFDPWTPSLLNRYTDSPEFMELAGGPSDEEWLEEEPSSVRDPPMAEDWTLVYESALVERLGRRLTSKVESILIDEEPGSTWIDSESWLPEEDLPSSAYLSEVFDDFSAWRSQWTSGEGLADGSRELAAYAEKSLTIEEPDYIPVAVPAEPLLGGLRLHPCPRRGGIDGTIVGSNEVIWRIEWWHDQNSRVWAKTTWLLGRLRELGICIGVKRWQRRAITELTERGTYYSLKEGGLRETTARSILKHDGSWRQSEPRKFRP